MCRFLTLLGGFAIGGLNVTATILVENVICFDSNTTLSLFEQCLAQIPPLMPRCLGNASGAGVRCVKGTEVIL